MNSLTKGILLEDNQELLTWGDSLNDIKRRLTGRKLDKGDRIIYDWGEHEILNGLSVRLSTTRWKTLSYLFTNKFNEINSWTIGDNEAQTEYSRISKHLTKNLGEPTEKDESSMSEKYMSWKFDSIFIKLYFFEQHCFKVVLTIKKEK